MMEMMRWGVIGVIGSLLMVGCSGPESNVQPAEEPQVGDGSQGNGGSGGGRTSGGGGTASQQQDAVGRKIPLTPNTPASVKSISIISTPIAGNTYGAGDAIAVEVSFTREVTASSEAILALRIGDNTRHATYEHGNGTDALTFVYTVSSADKNAKSIALAPNALAMNGDSVMVPKGKSIVDTHGNKAVLSLDGQTLADANNQSVDGGIERTAEVVRVRIASTPQQDNTYGATEDVEVEITYSKAMAVTGRPTLDIIIGAQTQRATYSGGDGTRKLTFGYTIDKTDVGSMTISTLSLNGGGILDIRGNGPKAIPDNLAAAAFTQAGNPTANGQVDHPPVVTDVRITTQPIQDDTYGETELILVDVVFSESISVAVTEGIVESRGVHDRSASSVSPTLALTIGSARRRAIFETGYSHGADFLAISPYLDVRPDLYGKDTQSLTFLYFVARSDLDPNGIGIAPDALSLPAGGAIFDAGGNSAELTLGEHAIAEDANHKIDGGVDRSPFVTDLAIVSSPRSGGDTYQAGEQIVVEVEFSEPVVMRNSHSIFLDKWDAAEIRPYIRLALDSSEEPWLLRALPRDVIPLKYGHRYSFTFADANPPGSFYYFAPPSVSGYDADGISIPANALALNGGSIEDINGNDADLDLSDHAIVNAGNHKVDTSTTFVEPPYVFDDKPRPTAKAIIWGDPPDWRWRLDRQIYSRTLPYLDESYSDFTLGEPMIIAIRFTEQVVVEGTPLLELRSKATVRYAKFQANQSFTEFGVRNDSFLFFSYTVRPSDFELGRVTVHPDSILLNGGSITNTEGDPVDLTIDLLASRPWRGADLWYEPYAPGSLIITSTATEQDPGSSYTSGYYIGGLNGGVIRGAAVSWATFAPIPPDDNIFRRDDHVYFWVWFTKEVTYTGTPYVEFTIGSEPRRATLYDRDPNSGNLGLFFRYTIQESDVGKIETPRHSIRGTILGPNNEPARLDLGFWWGVDFWDIEEGIFADGRTTSRRRTSSGGNDLIDVLFSNAQPHPGPYLPGPYLPGPYLPGPYLPGPYLPGQGRAHIHRPH